MVFPDFAVASYLTDRLAKAAGFVSPRATRSAESGDSDDCLVSDAVTALPTAGVTTARTDVVFAVEASLCVATRVAELMVDPAGMARPYPVRVAPATVALEAVPTDPSTARMLAAGAKPVSPAGVVDAVDVRAGGVAWDTPTEAGTP